MLHSLEDFSFSVDSRFGGMKATNKHRLLFCGLTSPLIVVTLTYSTHGWIGLDVVDNESDYDRSIYRTSLDSVLARDGINGDRHRPRMIEHKDLGLATT